MKHALTGCTCALLLGLWLPAHADVADDYYVSLFQTIQQADALISEGQEKQAYEKYLVALQGMESLKKNHPRWNAKIVDFRLGYLQDRIKPLAAKYPKPILADTMPVPAPSSVQTTPASSAPVVRTPESTALENEISRLNEQIIQLRIDRTTLGAKLEEALRAQPAPLDTSRLAEAEQAIEALKSQNASLRQSLQETSERASKAMDPAEISRLQVQLAEARQGMSESSEALTRLTAENLKLKSELQSTQSQSGTMQSANVTALKETHAQLEAREEELTRQRATMTALLEENESLRRDLKVREDEQTALQARLAAEQERLGAMVAKAELDRSKKEAERLRQELQVARNEARRADIMATELAEARKALEESGARVSLLTRQVSEARSAAGSMAELTSKVQMLEKQLTGSETLSQELTLQLNASRSDAAEQKRLAEAMGLQVRNLETELKSSRNRISELSRQLEAARSSGDAMTASLQREVQELRKAVAEKDASIAELNRQLQERPTVMVNQNDPETAKRLAMLENRLEEERQRADLADRQRAKLTALLTDPSVVLSAPATMAGSAGDEKMRALEMRNDALTAQVTALQRDLERSRQEAERAGADARGEMQGRIQELEDRLASQQRLIADSRESQAEAARLRARIKVLEAEPSPYTKAELALFVPPGNPGPLAEMPETTVTAVRVGNEPPTSMPIPREAGMLIAEAQSAFAKKDLRAAEDRYKLALKNADPNVFTLANLAAVQIERGNLRAARSNVEKALAIDPTSGFALLQAGNLEYRSGHLDEALDYLSRAVNLLPDSVDAHSSLGIVLSELGQRKAGEAAFRHVLQMDPEHAVAHHNLAVIYLAQEPPLLELARWHYNHAVDKGHARNKDLEARLGQFTP